MHVKVNSARQPAGQPRLTGSLFWRREETKRIEYVRIFVQYGYGIFPNFSGSLLDENHIIKNLEIKQQ